MLRSAREFSGYAIRATDGDDGGRELRASLQPTIPTIVAPTTTAAIIVRTRLPL